MTKRELMCCPIYNVTISHEMTKADEGLDQAGEDCDEVQQQSGETSRPGVTMAEAAV